jgi:Zn-dependent M28 family amino/carboxypeptidase
MVAAAAMVLPVTATAGKPSPQIPQKACDSRDNNQYSKLLECIRGSEVKQHLEALQAIASANGGTRAVDTAGFTASLDYVQNTMTAAGWDVSRVPFEYDGINLATQQVSPTPHDYESIAAIASGSGDITAPIAAVDIHLDPPRASTSGCEADDFAGFPSGAIALMQRGTCNFSLKVANAEAAGALAVIIFNQGNTPDREPLNIRPDLSDNPADVPVVMVSFQDGAALASALTARVQVEFFTATSYNIIADLHGVNDDNIVMAGAHLDSVPAGPGINDNGSGSAALLEIGQQLAHHVPQNTIRLAWWGGEELGLLGSTAWVGQQDEESLGRIALYMNFDMIASPNFIYMVYDANESTFPAPVAVPDGSTDIEATLESYLTLAKVPYDDTEFSGRSDYQAFIENGIPSSGLFTGAEEPKTAEQAAIWGGTVGAQLDPCYHEACDTIANVNDTALEVNSRAIAFAILKYSYSTESVNGVPGVRVPGNFSVPAPAGPQGTMG